MNRSQCPNIKAVYEEIAAQLCADGYHGFTAEDIQAVHQKAGQGGPAPQHVAGRVIAESLRLKLDAAQDVAKTKVDIIPPLNEM